MSYKNILNRIDSTYGIRDVNCFLILIKYSPSIILQCFCGWMDFSPLTSSISRFKNPFKESGANSLHNWDGG